jgi:hypothetical protein
MNRRTFFKASATGAAVVTLTPTALLTTGCSTAWITTVLNDLPEVVNIANSIVSIVALAQGNGSLATSAAVEITTAANAAKASLQTMQDAANAYNADKSQGNLNALIAATQAVQNDLNKLASSLPSGVLPQDVQVSIVAGLGLAISIMSAIQAIIPGAAPATVTALAVEAVSQGKVSVPNADTIRYAYNCTLRLHGFNAQTIK